MDMAVFGPNTCHLHGTFVMAVGNVELEVKPLLFIGRRFNSVGCSRFIRRLAHDPLKYYSFQKGTHLV